MMDINNPIREKNTHIYKYTYTPSLVCVYRSTHIHTGEGAQKLWVFVVKLTNSVDTSGFQIIGRADLAEATGCLTNCDLQTAQQAGDI